MHLLVLTINHIYVEVLMLWCLNPWYIFFWGIWHKEALEAPVSGDLILSFLELRQLTTQMLMSAPGISEIMIALH